MATAKKTTDNQPPDDASAAEVQAKTDEGTEKGYFGTTNDPNPNEAYSLASGPDSPSASETLEALKTAPANKGDDK